MSDLFETVGRLKSDAMGARETDLPRAVKSIEDADALTPRCTRRPRAKPGGGRKAR